ncbi:MAG: hypothetical protein VX262_09785 [Acidobacteriota bacterium]|nr:hypothetical protein [Acidobacteriota bacterium]
MQTQPLTPLVYEAVENTTTPTTILDVLMGSLAITGLIGLIGVLLGLMLAVSLLILRKRRGQDQLGPDGGGISLGLNSSEE